MTREYLEQTPEQRNTPDTHELESLLTDIHIAQQKLEKGSGINTADLQTQLAQVKAEVVRFHEDKEIIGNKGELEQLKQRVQTIKQQVETATIVGTSSSDMDALSTSAKEGRLREAQSVYKDIRNPESGVGWLDRTMQWFGDRV